MKAVPIAMLGLLAMVGAATRGGGAHSKNGPVRQAETTGFPVIMTLERVVQHGNHSTLVLRRANASVFDLKVPAGRSIGIQNQGRIAAGNLRSGDQLVLQRGGGVEDVSQRAVVFSGVVASAPISNTDVMTVQLKPSRTVLVDVDPQTRFTDIARGQDSLADVVDADTVSIRGVLDTAMDEVVVTQGIERLGPKIRRSYPST